MDALTNTQKFDIPEVAAFVPRVLKPWLFVLFVLIIQFSGGLYPALASHMIGTTAMMQDDILMAGCASLIGMSVNFAVMFRIKFRFSTQTQLLVCCAVLIAVHVVCISTSQVWLLGAACFLGGWFRMQATFACNSTLQPWITPHRNMAVFFCYVYLVVDSVMQLSGMTALYTAWFLKWEYMPLAFILLLALMMFVVLILLRPVRNPHFIPLLGIDWLGAALWSMAFWAFAYVCIYGDFYDWWTAAEIRIATFIGLGSVGLNLWMGTFLHHPYISFQTLNNRNIVRAALIYLVWSLFSATEHVFDHCYASDILGFDETNFIDLNRFSFAGIVGGSVFSFLTFGQRKWRYKTMVTIAFSGMLFYLAWFYFNIDYNLEKSRLFLPLFMRSFATITMAIVLLTSMVQSGLPFMVFPQALTLNGFMGAVLGATVGPAVLGEWLSRTLAKNLSHLGFSLTASQPKMWYLTIADITETVSRQALLVSLKEIYGWLLIITLLIVLLLLLHDLRNGIKILSLPKEMHAVSSEAMALPDKMKVT